MNQEAEYTFADYLFLGLVLTLVVWVAAWACELDLPKVLRILGVL